MSSSPRQHCAPDQRGIPQQRRQFLQLLWRWTLSAGLAGTGACLAVRRSEPVAGEDVPLCGRAGRDCGQCPAARRECCPAVATAGSRKTRAGT